MRLDLRYTKTICASVCAAIPRFFPNVFNLCITSVLPMSVKYSEFIIFVVFVGFVVMTVSTKSKFLTKSKYEHFVGPGHGGQTPQRHESGHGDRHPLVEGAVR